MRLPAQAWVHVQRGQAVWPVCRDAGGWGHCSPGKPVAFCFHRELRFCVVFSLASHSAFRRLPTVFCQLSVSFPSVSFPSVSFPSAFHLLSGVSLSALMICNIHTLHSKYAGGGDLDLHLPTHLVEKERIYNICHGGPFLTEICSVFLRVSNTQLRIMAIAIMRNCVFSIKGTQEWEFFWLRFWILYYFNVSYT